MSQKAAETDVPASPMVGPKLPSYLAEAFGDLYEEDGLVVLGRGMGWLSLLAACVRLYADADDGHTALLANSADFNEPETSKGLKSNEISFSKEMKTKSNTDEQTSPRRKRPLVFVIGLREYERDVLIAMLQSWGTPNEFLPLEITNESGQGKDRSVLYQRGGVFLITTRILIVDLLTKVANPSNIDGILVGHAENITEQSSEAFIIRIYRSQRNLENGFVANRFQSSPASNGFIKAFTESPDVLMSGFAKVDKILKALFVRKLYLYPRIHPSVTEELERSPPLVEELHQELTPTMKEIQHAIAAAVHTCIRELKSSTSLIEWSESDLTVENCVSTNFDLAVSRQLEHDWHRLKPQTKQLVSDLRTLRTLFQCLIQYDCISFWKLITSIKTVSASAKNPSMWLLTPAADLLFRKAKERIYTISKTTSEDGSNPMNALVPVLEENPKWRLLHQVLSEIRSDLDKRKDSNPQFAKNGCKILVMVKDARTLDGVKSYLVDGKEKTMTIRWIRYLEQINDRSRAVAKSSGGSSAISEESRLLLEEEGRARNFLFGPKRRAEKCLKNRKRGLNSIPSWKKKQRRVAVERSRGESTMQSEEDLQRRAILDEALGETERSIQMDLKEDEADLSSSDDEVNFLKVEAIDDVQVIIRTYTGIEGERGSLLLDDLKPHFVVLYDVDPSFIRALEVFSSLTQVKSASKEHRLKVYFMLFEASSEEKNFFKALEREQNAFERLIQHRKHMPAPLNTIHLTTQEMQQAMGGVGGSYAGGTMPLSIDTRTGRGKQNPNKDRREIAVDVREFRSALPSILHQGGMRLAPVTLTVGDFVLSSVHCVERKSISDLFGSFASGRLYIQAEAMCKHYECPCLLIEFDPAKSFSLQNPNDLGSEIRIDSICSKISLLVMHFPRLRILWSRSPHETLKIFKALKANHDEVDVDKAIEIGRNESIDAFLGSNSDSVEGEETEVNEAAREMLLRLPGVNVQKARKIMEKCDSIAELAEMTRDQLKGIVGAMLGQQLFTFFRQKFGAL